MGGMDGMGMGMDMMGMMGMGMGMGGMMGMIPDDMVTIPMHMITDGQDDRTWENTW
jgi:hypothetical protein